MPRWLDRLRERAWGAPAEVERKPLQAPEGAPSQFQHPDGQILWRPRDPVEASSRDNSGRVYAVTTARHKEVPDGQIFVQDGTVGEIASVGGVLLYVRVPSEKVYKVDKPSAPTGIASEVFGFHKSDWAPLVGDQERQILAQQAIPESAPIIVLDQFGTPYAIEKVSAALDEWCEENGAVKLMKFGTSLYVTPTEELTIPQVEMVTGFARDARRCFVQPLQVSETWVEATPIGKGTIWAIAQRDRAI